MAAQAGQGAFARNDAEVVDLTAASDLIHACRKAARQHGITGLALAEATARQQTAASPLARQRGAMLASSNPGLDPAHPNMAEAAAYAETIKRRASILGDHTPAGENNRQKPAPSSRRSTSMATDARALLPIEKVRPGQTHQVGQFIPSRPIYLASDSRAPRKFPRQHRSRTWRPFCNPHN
jgi:hypothetical protein